MRIHLINPDYGEKKSDMADRCRWLAQYVPSAVGLTMDCLTRTRVTIDSPEDVVLAAPEILSMARRAEAEGAASVGVYCFSDPAVSACREALSIPVVGGAEASMTMAALTGRRIAVILTDPARIPEKWQFLRGLDLGADRIAAIDAIPFAGRSLWAHREEALACFIEKGRELKDTCDADVLVPGCLSFLGLGDALSDAVGLPVIDPAVALVTMAAGMASMRQRAAWAI